MYDGNSSYKSLYKALEYYYDVLENTFIYIVNDWRTDDIKNGTLNAIKDLNLKIIHKIEIVSNKPEYHNGLFVAVLQK